MVIATNVPFIDRYVKRGMQESYHSYVVGLRVPKDALPRCLLWDTGRPYYYVRLASAAPDANYELLVVGGQDHQPARTSVRSSVTTKSKHGRGRAFRTPARSSTAGRAG